MKLEHFLIPYTNANTKWIKARHVMPETIKLLEQNTEHSLPSVLAIYVLICLLRKRKQKQEWSSGNLLSIKLCHSWKQTNKMLTKQRQPAEWEKIFANDITSKALISKIFILSSINSICKTKTTPKKNGRRSLIFLLGWLLWRQTSSLPQTWASLILAFLWVSQEEPGPVTVGRMICKYPGMPITPLIAGPNLILFNPP